MSVPAALISPALVIAAFWAPPRSSMLMPFKFLSTIKTDIVSSSSSLSGNLVPPESQSQCSASYRELPRLAVCGLGPAQQAGSTVGFRPAEHRSFGAHEDRFP